MSADIFLATASLATAVLLGVLAYLYHEEAPE